MRKKLIYISALISTPLLVYTILWFILVGSISSNLNERYANRHLATDSLGVSQQYFIKFKKIFSYGFPFKVAIKIVGWQEETTNSLIEFDSPIYIGYDLIKQICFISYSGEVTGKYKPVDLNFGSRFKIGNYLISAHIPLSFKLLKIFTQKKDLFEIVNFIKTIQLSSNNTQIFDLFNQEKLYDEKYITASFSFDKSKYYSNLEDIKNNIPQKLNITYSIKILESNIINHKILSGLLLYRFIWPFDFTFDGKFLVKTNNSSLDDFTKDLEIKVISAKSESKIQKSSTTLLYKIKVNANGNDTYLNISSNFDLKAGFSDSILESIKYLQLYLPQLLKNPPLLEELNYIKDNKSIFSLAELENRQYSCDLDMNLISKNKNSVRMQINNLSLFSANSGLKLSSEFKINSFKDIDVTGILVFYNYLKTTDLLTNYFFNLGRYKTFSKDSRSIYKEGTQYFLKTISDHPNSNSNDISFEYELSSNDVEKWKIGTAEFDNIKPLYYLALYRKALEKISNDENNMINKLQELVPDFTEHQKFLKELMIQPFPSLDEGFSKEIIN